VVKGGEIRNDTSRNAQLVVSSSCLARRIFVLHQTVVRIFHSFPLIIINAMQCEIISIASQMAPYPLRKKQIQALCLPFLSKYRPVLWLLCVSSLLRIAVCNKCCVSEGGCNCLLREYATSKF
jgi:hypothetical protein